MKVQPTLLSVIGFFWCQLFNAYWPAFLGGTPRWFRMLSGSPDFVTLSKVKEMAERGSLKSVIDSIWEMQDAIMVRLTFFSTYLAEADVTFRHIKGLSRNIRRVKF